MVTIRKPEQLEKTYFTKELYDGLEETWKARLFPAMWLVKRVGFVTVIFLLSDMNYILKFTIFIMSQSIYIIGLCVSFPFKAYKDFAGELCNEIFLLIGICAPVYLNDEKDWDTRENTVYLGALFLSNCIFTLISVGAFFGKIITERFFTHKPNVPRKTRVIDISRDQTREQIMHQSNFYSNQVRVIPEEKKVPMGETKDTMMYSQYTKNTLQTIHENPESPKKSKFANSPTQKKKRIKAKIKDDVMNDEVVDKLPPNIRKLFKF